MWLVCSLATSGLLDRDKPLDDPSQPWPVACAAALFDDAGEMHDRMNPMVLPKGRLISSDATAIHGITARQAEREGQMEAVALAYLVGMASNAEAVVGFGMTFMRDVITTALMRAGRPTTRWLRPGLQFIDLIQPAAAACKLPSEHESGTYRWPSLDTAANALGFGVNPVSLRNTWSDMELAARIFFTLKIRNMIELGPTPRPDAGGSASPTPRVDPPAPIAGDAA